MSYSVIVGVDLLFDKKKKNRNTICLETWFFLAPSKLELEF